MAALHRIDAFANEAVASMAFEERVAVLSACSEVPAQLQGANEVAGLAPEAFQLTVLFQEEKDRYHTLLLTRSGAVLGPEQKIPVVEALAAVTIRAAWQYFEEGEKGSLREGKRADLVLLERDPLTADPMSLRDIPVLATWKDGRLIYRREG